MIVARRPFPRIPRHFRAQTFASIPKVPWLMFSERRFLTPFPATHPQNSLVTPFAATHTNSPSCKSFPCHTYKKQGGVPCAARPLEQGGVRAALRLFSIQLR